MKKLLIVMTLLFASSTSAQYPTTSFTAGGNITAASASCLATNCVPIKLPASATTLTVGVTGTFSATLAVEESQDGGRTWTSAGSNITGAGTTSFTITAFSDFRVRASAYVSGNAGINILVSASTNSGGGGGGGFTPSINGTPLSTAGLNLETSTANVTGLTCTPTLVSTINVIPCEISGTLNAANGQISGLTTGFFPKASAANNIANSLCDEGITTANTVTCADTSGMAAVSFVSTQSTAGFVDYPQGPTSGALPLCAASSSICEQAPTSVTSYLVNKPGGAANGVVTNSVTSAVDTQGFSGDTNHSTTVSFTASQTVTATTLCPAATCTAGTYVVNLYIDITTACTTTGTLIPWVGFTDDAGAKGSTTTTFFGSASGAGFVAATGTLTTTAVTNFASGPFTLRSTGAAAITYGYTSSACGSGSLAGKMYLSVVPVQ